MALILPPPGKFPNYDTAKKVQGILIILLIAVIALRVIDIKLSDENMAYILYGFAGLSFACMFSGFLISGTDPFLGLSPFGYQ